MIVFSIPPGASPQWLHYDESIHYWVSKAVDSYPAKMGRDSSLSFFFAAKDATKEKRATRFIPGSHLWAHEQAPDESLSYYVEMEKEKGTLP